MKLEILQTEDMDDALPFEVYLDGELIAAFTTKKAALVYVRIVVTALETGAV